MNDNFIPEVLKNATIECPTLCRMDDFYKQIPLFDMSTFEQESDEMRASAWENLVDSAPKGMCYENGKLYFGEVKDELPNGRGMLINVYGEEYVGQFENGKPMGMLFYRNIDGIRGRIKINGDKIEYTLRDTLNYRDLTNAKSIDFVDGDRYIGEVNEFNRPQGLGKLIGKRGILMYGYFHDGVIHGVGVMEYSSGLIIKGLFKDGRTNGFCMKKKSANDIAYAMFRQGVLNGWGIHKIDELIKVECYDDGKLLYSEQAWD